MIWCHTIGSTLLPTSLCVQDLGQIWIEADKQKCFKPKYDFLCHKIGSTLLAFFYSGTQMVLKNRNYLK